MVVNIEVFTSPTCPYCPMAIEVVDEAKKESLIIQKKNSETKLMSKRST